ncbi:MAG: hypothetical protein IJ228_05485 [Succinivibrio sp.]|nr:hypothetical protein [Succinivibrio sp.]
MALKLGIPVVSMERAEEYVSTHPGEIDLVVSYLYWRKIRRPLIEGPKLGCINFHPAILPDWRGCAGYNIAILKKLKEWGATAHYVEETIDTGPIIRVFKFNFDYRLETAQSLERKTQEAQVELYKSVMLDIMEHGRLDSVPQNKDEGVYISRQQMLDLMKIDLNDAATLEDLDLKIRACWFPPYSGAGFELNGKFYTLVNDEILRTLQPADTTAQL